VNVVKYRLRASFNVDVGFLVSARQVLEATDLTNSILADLLVVCIAA
jgi:hypothetical protein